MLHLNQTIASFKSSFIKDFSLHVLLFWIIFSLWRHFPDHPTTAWSFQHCHYENSQYWVHFWCWISSLSLTLTQRQRCGPWATSAPRGSSQVLRYTCFSYFNQTLPVCFVETSNTVSINDCLYVFKMFFSSYFYVVLFSRGPCWPLNVSQKEFGNTLSFTLMVLTALSVQNILDSAILL